jgi:hypothetical protein
MEIKGSFFDLLTVNCPEKSSSGNKGVRPIIKFNFILMEISTPLLPVEYIINMMRYVAI